MSENEKYKIAESLYHLGFTLDQVIAIEAFVKAIIVEQRREEDA